MSDDSIFGGQGAQRVKNTGETAFFFCRSFPVRSREPWWRQPSRPGLAKPHSCADRGLHGPWSGEEGGSAEGSTRGHPPNTCRPQCHQVRQWDSVMGTPPWEVPRYPAWLSCWNEQCLLTLVLCRIPKKLEPLAQWFSIGAILHPSAPPRPAQGPSDNVWRHFSPSGLGSYSWHMASRRQGCC